MIRQGVRKSIIAGVIAIASFAEAICTAETLEQFIATKRSEVVTTPDPALSGWNAFEQTLGDEKMLLHFPDTPAFTRINDNWGVSLAMDGKTEYWLMAPMPALSSVKKEILFPMFIEKYSSKPYSNTVTNVLEENGIPILEIEAYNKKTRKMEHVRVIVTEKNFYVAAAKYKKSRKINGQPSLFLESIYVLK